MIQTKLKGMGVALITPFKEDESVDYDALMRMVDYLLQNNADFLCVLGTTAETPTLTEEEKKTIKKMVIDRVNGRIPILLGVGGNNNSRYCRNIEKRLILQGLMRYCLWCHIIINLLKKVFISIIKRLRKLRSSPSYCIMFRDVRE